MLNTFKVYANASSHQDAFIECPEWMHRLLIGQKGATIREISDRFGNEKVNINFQREGKVGIELEGTPSELDAVKECELLVLIWKINYLRDPNKTS